MADTCIFDNPEYAAGQCIFDNDLLDTAKTRPYRKGWSWQELDRDDDDILTIIMCATQTIH